MKMTQPFLCKMGMCEYWPKNGSKWQGKKIYVSLHLSLFKDTPGHHPIPDLYSISFVNTAIAPVAVVDSE
jgi:hypothetical protein